MEADKALEHLLVLYKEEKIKKINPHVFYLKEHCEYYKLLDIFQRVPDEEILKKVKEAKEFFSLT
jgi:hypothetical protein